MRCTILIAGLLFCLVVQGCARHRAVFDTTAGELPSDSQVALVKQTGGWYGMQVKCVSRIPRDGSSNEVVVFDTPWRGRKPSWFAIRLAPGKYRIFADFDPQGGFQDELDIEFCDKEVDPDLGINRVFELEAGHVYLAEFRSVRLSWDPETFEFAATFEDVTTGGILYRKSERVTLPVQ